MGFNGRLEMKTTDILMKDRGLGLNRKVQKFVDSEVIRLMRPYTPALTGVLADSPTSATPIG